MTSAEFLEEYHLLTDMGWDRWTLIRAFNYRNEDAFDRRLQRALRDCKGSL